jgi:hypothetical protein
MTSVGFLTVQVAHGQLNVALERENLAARLCNGRRFDEAIKRIDQTYQICRHAQNLAAHLAIYGEEPDEGASTRVRLEIVEQLLWRWLVDWAPLTLNENHLPAFAQVRKAIARYLKSPEATTGSTIPFELTGELVEIIKLLTDHSPMDFMAMSATQFINWIDHSSGLAARIIRDQAAGDVEELLRTSLSFSDCMRFSSIADFQPESDIHTSAFAEFREDARLHVLKDQLPGIQILLLSRLFLLIDQLQKLQQPNVVPIGGCLHEGDASNHRDVRLSWVLTARGLLIHRVSVDAQEQAVKDYEVYAPTDLNFKSAHYVNSILGFTDLTQVNRLQRDLECSVLALDPCVAYNVEVDHA